MVCIFEIKVNTYTDSRPALQRNEFKSISQLQTTGISIFNFTHSTYYDKLTESIRSWIKINLCFFVLWRELGQKRQLRRFNSELAMQCDFEHAPVIYICLFCFNAFLASRPELCIFFIRCCLC